MKLSYVDLFDIKFPVSKDFLSYYDKCYRVSHNEREGFVLLGHFHEIFVPRDLMTSYSVKILDSLPSGQPGGFILEEKIINETKNS